ncbi:MAG: EAL domain-containing protein [Chloroflexi bacterium]|nr:EAL domain-containing protein [Chloroflexota bacterium]
MAILLVVVTALALAAGAVVVIQMRNQMSAEADARLQRHGDQQAVAVDAVVESAARDLRLASRNAVFGEALIQAGNVLPVTERDLVETAIRYSGQRYAVDEICLIRRDGLEMARYDKGAIAAVADLSPDETDGNPAFLPGIALPDDAVHTTDPYVSPDSGRWVLGLATPIVQGSATLGILHFELPLAAFSGALSARPFGAAGYTFIVGTDGRLLDHPFIADYRRAAGLDPDPATGAFPPATALGSESWRAAIGGIVTGRTSGAFKDGAEPVHFVARSILGGRALAVTAIPESELYADIDRAQLNLLVTIGPLVVLIVVLTGWFVRRLFTSNGRLATAMQASDELATIVSTADDAILSVDNHGRILTWNDGAERAFRATRAGVVGRPAIDLFPPDHRDEVQTRLDGVAASGGVDRFETVIRSGGDELIDALLTLSPIRAADGAVSGLSVIARDISARKRLEEQLEHQALHDSLTGLPNRALFRDRLDQALSRHGRPLVIDRASTTTGVLFIDLDDFKVINDTLGHKIGDELLIEVGRRIDAAIRPGDTAARLGGDEFTVLLEDLDDASRARVIADRILAALAAPFRLEGHDVVIGASIGIVVSDRHAAGPDELLRSADTALYEAKGKGKGQHATFHEEMSERAWYRLELEAELRKAINDGQMIVEYQPIVDLQTGDITELEALVRWRHPSHGIIPPNDFIGLAEETGLIVSIGEQVLAMATMAVAGLRAERPDLGGVGLAINVSPRELRRSDLVETFGAACVAAGLPRTALKIEITEGIQLDDAASISRLETLRASGVRISIDDFGTGYSSLASFRTMPVDGLKLDRLFVAALGEAREETAIVTATIAFGAALLVDVTAEGIETPTQLALLRTLGCRFGQGYLFARPMSIEQVALLPARLSVPAAAWTGTATIADIPFPAAPVSPSRQITRPALPGRRTAVPVARV